MRSNPGISPRLRHALPPDAAGGRAAIWNTMLGLFLAITLAFWLPAVPTEAQSQASRTYVSGLGKDTNACTAATPCLTLQTALSQTAPGGEIYSLDSANYGSVTINKAVSILAGRGATGVLATSNLSGVTINAGANDVITLQGLDIDGAGSGVSGIEFYSGASLNLQDSVIRGFTTGINFHPGGSSTLSVSRTLISNNSTGINFLSAGTSTAVLNDVQVVNNGTGITALGASTSALANVTVQSSIVANNSTVGVAAGAYSAVSIANSTVTNNFAGLQAQAASSLLQVSGSNVTGNRTAWQTANGGQITSASQNSFGGNASGDTAPPPAPPPPPTFIAKNIVTDFGARCDGVADAAAAFASFNTWAQQQALPIQLTIPPGSICQFISDVGAWWAKGIKQLLVIGYGATIGDANGTGYGFFLGGLGVVHDNQHSARIATVTAGASSVTLLNLSDSSKFAVGNYALMAGLDLMGYGYPPNPHYFEYVQITGIDSASGTVTFNVPLKNTYKSTWPTYFAGSQFEADQGGPATLYALDPSWNTQVEYDGLTISRPNGQTYAVGKSVTYKDVTFTGENCGIPTENLVWQAINVTMLTCGIEADKLVGTVAFTGGTIHSITFQSSSIDLLTMDGTTVTGFINGTPKNAIIANSTIANFNPGAIAFGRSDQVTCTNCELAAISPLGVVDRGGPGDPGVNNVYTMAGGVITVPNSLAPLRWAVPGTDAFWVGQYDNEGPFTIVDVTQDATNTYVRTSMTGGFPSIPTYAGKLYIRVHPAPQFTCTNCTGSADAIDLSQAPAGAPIYSYSKRTYSGATIVSTPGVHLWGTIVEAKMTIAQSYSGMQSTLSLNAVAQFNNYPTISSNGSILYFGPIVNTKLLGERDVLPFSVTGARSGDSLSAPGSVWFTGPVAPYLTTNVSTESSSVWPIITIEISTNQSVVNP
jgi:hypothetical protein